MMSTRGLQEQLNAAGAAKVRLTLDGIANRATQEALEVFLRARVAESVLANWALPRRMLAGEQLVYARAGIEVGEIDGLEGEQTRYAREVYEARARNGGREVSAVEKWRDAEAAKPLAVPVPPQAAQWPRQRDVAAFYGTPGVGNSAEHALTRITFPVPMRIAWDPAKRVASTQIHSKCADAFKAIWTNALAHYGEAEFRRLRLDLYGGTYVPRRMRGGSAWSMHAYGCACDIDPERNQLRWGADKATLDDTAYAPFWRIVEAQGGLSLGRVKNYDWMHFQFTRDFS